MKRKLHFLLAVGIGLTASVGWLHAENSKLAKDENVTFKESSGFTFVYAQGNPVTVSAGTNGSTIIKADNEQLEIAADKVDKLYLFGGSKNGTVASTKITIESGKISNVFGGGYGELTGNSTHAVVSDTSKIIVKGGSIHNIFGGGLYYSKSKVVKIDISNVTMDDNAWVMCGGLESGKTSGSIYPAFESSTNTVDSGILNITGGTFCYVAIGGTDGSKGYVKKAEAYISNATIVGLFGNGSNGASDDVEGKITNCTFAAKGTNYPVEVAAINRGHVKNVKLEFDNCTFPTGETFCFVGGTSEWKKFYNGSEVQVVNPGKISYSFTGCTNTPVLGLSDGLDAANVEVTGAKVRIAPFNNGVDQPITAFNIGEGKTWTFNDGLAMASGVTLTKTGNLVYTGILEANVATAEELKAAVALGADVINLADATYELGETLTLTKGMVLQGTDTAKCIIKGAVTLSSEDIADVSLRGLRFDYSPTKIVKTTTPVDSCIPLIGIKGKVNLAVENCRFNNQTVGYGAYNTMKPAREYQHVFYTAPDATGQLTVENSVINLNANCQTAVLVDGVMDNISFTNVKINGNQEKGSSQYGVYIFHETTPVTLDNTTILLNNHYCVIAKHAGNQTLTIKNKSNLSGYGAIYLYGTSNMTVNVLGESILTGNTKNSGVSDSFAAIVIASTGKKVGANNTIVVQDSYVGNKFSAKTTKGMTPIRISSNSIHPINNKVILKGKTIVRTLNNETNPTIVGYGYDLAEDNNTVVVEGDQVQFKDQDDKDCIIIYDSKGLFRNATVSIPAAIDFGELYGSTYYHEAIARTGNKIVIADTTIVKTLLSLNAAKDFFFTAPSGATSWKAYTIPDSIIFECKDGYLVTGEKAADAFANSVNDKAVFYLKQTATEFTPVAAGNNRVKVATDATWNEATHANRSVEIAANAILTVNVAMPLDTVFMAEGAQLVANANVTAKVVQLTYGVKKTWKAFGFPYEIGKIVGVNDDKTDVKTVASSADKGIWTASIKNAEPVFEVSSNNATPAASCIIAAHKDSTILVTSKTTDNALVSLVSQPEPNAPVVTKTGEVVNFKIVSNPNIYDMTLTQTAYVLSEDGKTFDRVDNPTIKAFQSFVLADEGTTSTLRSLRVDDTPTGNEIVPTDGYYVRTGKGTITIHTAEPVQVMVVDMLGRIYYNARVNDGTQIAVPAGIYAVNRQKVIVK